MKKIIFIIFYVYPFLLFSQKTFYLDSNMKNIDYLTYAEECNNLMKKCYKITRNDSIINVAYDEFKFGKLTEYENKRVRKEIYKSKDYYKGNILIHYINKRNSFEEIREWRIKMKKKYDSMYYPHAVKYVIDTRKIVIESRKLSKKVNKCIKRLEKKYDVDVLHYYLEGNIEYAYELNWIKDKNKIIKNYFFKYYPNYYFVLIKPNGEFLQIGGLITPRKLKRLLKNDDWSKYIEDLKRSEKAKEPKGFFIMQNIYNCL